MGDVFKVGDRVIVSNRSTSKLRQVVKISGRHKHVVLDDGTKWNQIGRLVGDRDVWSTESIRLATPERLDAYRLEVARRYVSGWRPPTVAPKYVLELRNKLKDIDVWTKSLEAKAKSIQVVVTRQTTWTVEGRDDPPRVIVHEAGANVCEYRGEERLPTEAREQPLLADAIREAWAHL